MADSFSSKRVALADPAAHAAAVTPHNSNDLATSARALFVGTGGDVKVNTVGGETVIFSNVPDGTLLPVRVSRVFATGTTADDIVALW